MNLRRVIAPNETLISLATAKEYLRATTGDDEDATIQLCIDGAMASIDGLGGSLGRAILPQTWDLTLDAFPCDGGKIELPLPPLQSVIFLKYYNAAGTLTTMDSDDYYVDWYHELGRILPVLAWPSAMVRPSAVQVRFLAGYNGAAQVPPQIVSALLLRIGDLYANRETGIAGVSLTPNPAFDNLIDPFRVLRV